jgi:RNA polymerase sigma-70 factor (ECF subfamily)
MSSSATSGFPISSRAEFDLHSECEPSNAGAEAVQVGDEVLLARLKQEDKTALGLLFHRYSRLLLGVAQRILRDTSEAEDLVQDVFLFIERKCAVFDSSKSSARSWIIQMAYQRALDRRRYLTTRHFYTNEQIELDDSPSRQLMTLESDYSAETVYGRNGLTKVLGALSDDQRETLRLYFFEGYSLAEISAKVGQPLGAIRNRYYRGLDKLRKQMFGRTLQDR